MDSLVVTDRMPPSVDARVVLAAERTFLAWVRTGIALMGFGFIVARFGLFLRELAAARGLNSSGQHGVSLWFGIALVLLGIVIVVGSAFDHARFRRRAASGIISLPVRTHAVWAALTLALMGVGLVIALLALA